MHYEIIVLYKTIIKNECVQYTKSLVSDIERKKIINVNFLGERKLAYNIKGFSKSYYVIIKFFKEKEILNILRRNIKKLGGVVLRFLILKTKSTSKMKNISD
ncbi:30S ribosomal protein S6 [Candidatus Vidania fulgoroideorum]